MDNINYNVGINELIDSNRKGETLIAQINFAQIYAGTKPDEFYNFADIDLLNRLTDCADYLVLHNKNLTREQYSRATDMAEILHALRGVKL